MKKIISTIATGALVLSTMAYSPLTSLADSNSINFESPTYTIGNINGQDGWTATGSAGSGCAVYDEGVSGSFGYPTFGAQSFRISDAVTSGCFSDQAFAKPLLNAVGEVDSTDGTFSRGTLQSHFETQFDIASTQAAEQTGLHISVSPDRGDGSRMSYLRFEDSSAGVNVFFVDVQGTSNPANFVETQIATGLSRASAHTVKIIMDLVNGPSNDLVRVYIGGALVHTGTSWENYYRYDSESAAEQSPRIVKTVLFRAGGTANPNNAGKGFLFDNLTLSSSVSDQSCTDAVLVSSTSTQFKGLTTTDPIGSSADGLFTGGTAPAVVAAPDGFPGAWDTASSDLDVAGAQWVNNTSIAPSNPAGAGGDGTINSWRLFSQSFIIPANASIVSASLHFTADNSVEAFLDNSSVGTSASFATVADASLSLASGSHELEFVVKNDAYSGSTNPTGVIYKAMYSYCVPISSVVISCPAAPAVANAYMKEQGIKANTAAYKNVVAKVAQEMGPQTKFKGSFPCDPDYATKVQSFVTTNITP
jgi:hypothetical protein